VKKNNYAMIVKVKKEKGLIPEKATHTIA